MKLTKLGAIILLTALMALFLAGVWTAETSSIKSEANVNAPKAVAYHALADVQDYSKWCTIFTSNLPGKSKQYQKIYHINDHRLILKEAMILYPEEHRIIFHQVNPVKQQRILSDFKQTITMKQLADGTTQIQWQIEYRITPLMSRIADRLWIQPAFESVLKRQMKAYKDYLEG